MKEYIALGDSIPIDDHPEHETGIAGIGAASLFHRALAERYPGIRFVNHTADGATTDDVLRWQLPRVDLDDAPAIITITAGGNDMLLHLRAPRPPVRLIAGIRERLTRIVDETVERRPQAFILLGTVYDPWDGTNELGERLDREAEWLARVNEHIRAICDAHPNVHLADIHARFLRAEEVAKLWIEALDYHRAHVREQVR